MLNVGFEEDVEAILHDCPAGRQTFLFSATMPQWVKQITKKFLKAQHVVVDLVGDSKQKVADTIDLMTCAVSQTSRTSIVMDLVTVYAKDKKCICFTQTKRAADELTAALGKRVSCEVLHGDIARAQRERTLQRFRDNRFTVLIATDVAARGLDISDVDLVIHYELPNDVESFVHRCGRTGRAGQQGAAIAMYTDRESYMIRRIQKETGCDFRAIDIPSSTEVMDACAVTASNALSKVDSELLPFFAPTAKKLLPENAGEDITQILAAALAAISGQTEAPPPRSLLTGAPNSCTYMVVDSADSEPAIRAGDLLRALTEIDRKLADGCGKIRFLANKNGLCFDIDAAYMSDLETVTDLNGFDLSVCTKLPDLMAEQTRERSGGRGGGRFGGRGRGGRGGRSFGGRGGDRGRGGGFRDDYGERRGGRGGGRDFGDRRGGGGRGDFGDRGGRSDRPRRDFDDRPPRRDFNYRPPRRDYGGDGYGSRERSPAPRGGDSGGWGGW